MFVCDGAGISGVNVLFKGKLNKMRIFFLEQPCNTLELITAGAG